MIEDLKHKFENYKPYINGYKNMKRASVLIPIVKKDNMHYILFQVRSKNLKSQPNEISFPGGKIENNESPLDAVIRETCEELGTNVKNVNIISPIDLLITPGNMIIHPFVVDHIFLIPLSYLLKHKPSLYNNEVKVIPNDNFPYDIIPNKKDYKFATSNYRVLFYKYENYVIWGITAKILENFLEFLEV